MAKELELEVGPEDLVKLLKKGAIKSGKYIIALAEDDPDDLDDWEILKKSVEEKIAEVADLEVADDDEETTKPEGGKESDGEPDEETDEEETEDDEESPEDVESPEEGE